MNLLQFYNKIAEDNSNPRNRSAKFLSKEISTFNIINNTFSDQDVNKIQMNSSISNPQFNIELRTEAIASCAENNLDNSIIPGAYHPLYRIKATSDGNVLKLQLEEV